MFKYIITASAALALFSGGAYAAGDLSRANIETVAMEMGTNDDGMFFSPNEFTWETGHAIKWVLTNSDDIKHELAIHELRERVFTRKLEISDADGNLVAEIKGDINEVEIGPHQVVEWFLVPVQTADKVEITCEIEGHKEAGMYGFVTLQ